MLKVKEDENFNHRNTSSISRIALKLHCVPKFESDAEIGQKGAFCKGLVTIIGIFHPFFLPINSVLLLADLVVFNF